jgi:hypothetical protein
MKAETISRRISSAIAVRWTPALAARVERRIGHRLAQRRRRRRVAAMALAFFGLAGAAYAFTRPWAHHARRVATGAAGPASSLPTPAPAPVAPAPVDPGVPESAAVTVGPAAEQRPTSRRAVALRHRAAPETVEALLAAADAARLGGRPADAVAPLTAIFTRHASDPRAALAAYELGRVLAIDLHDNARAAEAFAKAHDLDPTGPLAGDAAAHAAEARREAGEGEAR